MASLFELPITIYSEITPYNDVLSKARCRVFYKYENRNGTYITDEFSEKLISSAAYAPIKGIYIEDDFSDHGYTNSQGRIYGIIPESFNFAWEKHLDSDGVEREYACFDVLLFTALYGDEGKSIVGKSLSMELYEPTLTFHRAVYNGLPYIVFEDGCFLGLQVLGDKVEPCFQGAAFYSKQDLQDTIESAIQKIKQYSVDLVQGENSNMDTQYKLSHNATFNALWTLLNPDFDKTWDLNYEICDVYDDYALVYDCKNRKYERAYYTKNDAEDSVEITEQVAAYVLDVTEAEKATLDTLRTLNGGTYELVSEELEKASENFTKISTLETENVKLAEENDKLTLEAEVQKANFEALQSSFDLAQAAQEDLTNQVNDLNAQLGILTQFKENVERKNKEAVINEYAGKLSNETLESYKAKVDEYSLIDLDKELAYELKNTNFSLFDTQNMNIIPKEVDPNGIEGILSNY